jgi:RNA polymerase sigma factor (TIGR02999 family)
MSARDGLLAARPLRHAAALTVRELQDMPGDQSAVRDPKHELFTTLYKELRQLAERQLRRSPGASISPTTLLHETWLGLCQRDASFPDRARFMGYAARAMRGVIIDFVRERHALKRGGEFHITQIDSQIPEPANDVELARLSDALDELAGHDERLAQVVDLRYFCGLSFADIAALRGTSERTVQRDWEKARLLLFRELKPQD